MNGSLAERGFRLVRTRAGVWVWRHPHDVQADDLDGTDMSDAEFEAAVLAKPNQPLTRQAL